MTREQAGLLGLARWGLLRRGREAVVPPLASGDGSTDRGEGKSRASDRQGCFRSGDEPPDLVFYDITSTYFEGDRSLVEDDFRRYGYSRDTRFDRRQVVIGMVITQDGIPLCHHVFPGNTR